MRTSAAGASDAAREGGFTLLELLVVLVILGIASAGVMLAMPDARGSLAGEAERFAARAKAAQERAILESRTVGLDVDATGYAFRRHSAGAWQTLESFRWGEGVRARPVQGRFDSTGIAEPANVTLIRGDETAEVAIAADGAIHVRP